MDKDIAAEMAAFAIPIVSIVLGIGFAMVQAWLSYRRRSEALRYYHAERLAAIEKGLELPPPPAGLIEDRSPSEPGWVRHRRNGLILLGVGLAVSAALWGTHNRNYLWGLVPAAIGAAFLIASLLEAQEQRLPPPGNPPPRG